MTASAVPVHRQRQRRKRDAGEWNGQQGGGEQVNRIVCPIRASAEFPRQEKKNTRPHQPNADITDHESKRHQYESERPPKAPECNCELEQDKRRQQNKQQAGALEKCPRTGFQNVFDRKYLVI